MSTAEKRAEKERLKAEEKEKARVIEQLESSLKAKENRAENAAQQPGKSDRKEHRRLAVTVEKCHHCFSNPELQKHLLITIGTKVYLSLPGGVSLTEGHCLIAPLQHHRSATGLDEDVWTEIQKAIMECDEEWAMRKKVVDLSSKDICHAVPRGLPYFSVDFGLQGSFFHVIENEHKFPHYFVKEIVGGMLDVEPRIWRKSIRENFDDQQKKVLEFCQWWKPFDCTKTDS
ncbi:CWF19-like protein 2 [Coregonus clupeaformis]|uniref:CWF19-like protein 2 n=1 Tax=Coregonus clupeaformis TaxID=59861 RepID=UPI001E1C7C2D|nr:CWF19-like protein 2 [Coregonus clupeaformis]